MALSRRTRKRLVILGIIGLAGIGGVVTLKLVNRAQAQRTFEAKREAGFAAYEEGNYTEAFSDLQYVYWATPQNERTSDLVLSLAQCRAKVPAENGSHILRAIDLAQESIRIDPANSDADELLLDLYARIRYFTELRTVAERMLAKDSTDRIAMERQIEAFNGLGMVDDAVSTARALVDAYPDDLSAHSVLVQVLLLNGGTTGEAADYAKQLAEQNDDRMQAHLIHAAASLSVGRLVEGAEAARRASTMELNDMEELSSLLFVLDSATAQDPELATIADRVLEAQISSGDHGDEAALIAAERAWCSGRSSDVPGLLERVLENPQDAPNDALGWAGLSGHEDAAEFAAILSERQSRIASIWAALIRATASAEDGDLDRALESAKTVSEFGPSEFEFLGSADLAAEFVLATIERQMGLTRSAEVRLTDLARVPAWRIARLALAELYLDTSRSHLAASVLAQDRVLTRTRAGALAYVRSMIQGAEGNSPGAPDPEAILQTISSIESQVPSHLILPYRLRAEVLSGDAAAAELTLDLIEAEGSKDVGSLLVAARNAPDPIAERIYDFLGEDAATAVSIAQAFDGGASSSVSEAIAELDRKIANAENDGARQVLGIARIEALDRARHPDTVEAMRKLSDQYPAAPSVQLAVLGSVSAWQDEPLVSRAIERLRAVTGDDDPSWPLFDARRLLAFGDGQRDLADAIQNLKRVLVSNPNDEAALLLSAEAWGQLGDNDRRLETLGRAWDSGGSPGRVLPQLIVGLREAGRLRDAERRLDEFVSLGILEVNAMRRRAALLELFGRWDDAVRERRSLAESNDANDLHALGVLLARTGNATEAGGVFARLAEAPGVTPEQVEDIASFEAGRSGASAGLAILDRLNGVDEPGRLTRRRADLLKRLGEDDAAVELIDAQLIEVPDDHTSRRWLVRHWITRGDVESARLVLDAAPGGWKTQPELSVMGELLDRAEEGGEGLMASLATMAAEETSSAAMQALAEALSFRADNPEQDERFLSMLKELTTNSPAFYPGWASYIGLLNERGDSVQAIAAARTATRLLPGDPRPARDAAQLLAVAGRAEEARSAAEEWRRRSISDALSPDVFLARLDIDQDEPGRAVRTLRPWIDRGAGASRQDVLEAWALALAADGKPDEARAAIRAGSLGGDEELGLSIRIAVALAGVPDLAREWLGGIDSEKSLDVAAAYLALAERTGTDADVDAVVAAIGDADSYDDASSAWMLLGGAELVRGDQDAAREAFANAVDRDGSNREASLALARLRSDGAGNEAELRALIAGGSDDRVSRRAMAELAVLLSRRGSTGEAESLARELAGTGIDTLLARLEVALRAGSDATDLLGAAARPELLSGLAELARRLDGEGLVSETIGIYRSIQGVIPDNPAVLNNLAYALVRTSDERSPGASEAVVLSRQAVRIVRSADAQPTMLAAFLHTHGAALSLSGDSAGAKQAFSESLELNPDSASSRVGLAEILAEEGDEDEARRLLGDAASLDDRELKERAQALLRTLD